MRVLLSYAIWDDKKLSNKVIIFRMSFIQVLIFFMYLLSAGMFVTSRLPKYSASQRKFLNLAFVINVIGISLHIIFLYSPMLAGDGLNFSFGNIISMIGLELAIIGLISAIQPTLRGISAGLLFLGAIAVALGAITIAVIGLGESAPDMIKLSWQMRSHILISLISYGLLYVGAIIAVMMMLQEKRLRASKLSAISSIFAPLETSENLLFKITAVGFTGLAITIVSGLTFVDNLFAQPLVHKTALSLIALFIFGALLAGRIFAGWRGSRAIKLYLSGFVLLFIAYFGVRLFLEQILGQSWS
ncbi:MAG: hypothetical protein CMQ54_03745 [Gammaproteobacteria bacterium]|nr:hypothetical protein [Gammaproteobacteria bacterium]